MTWLKGLEKIPKFQQMKQIKKIISIFFVLTLNRSDLTKNETDWFLKKFSLLFNNLYVLLNLNIKITLFL